MKVRNIQSLRHRNTWLTSNNIEDTSKHDTAIEMTGIAIPHDDEHTESQERLIRSSTTGVDQSA
jgi:hypothetical protein